MNIIFDGTYKIYNNEIEVFSHLAPATYNVCFDKMKGFFLAKRPDLRVNEEKIYGNFSEKVSKVLWSFMKGFNRNLGVIVSGEKGSGKSLLVRLLAKSCLTNLLPVLIVSDPYPGIANFLASIDQEVVVIFDEFEKVFHKQENRNPQEELLPLFDGLDNGKKLFIITCNDPTMLNDCIINRPGRFHYHFAISAPKAENIKEYLEDNLKDSLENRQEKIDKITNFSYTTNITYDILRSIVFELNQEYSVEETLNDLNISRDPRGTLFDIEVTLSNKVLYCDSYCSIDLYSNTVNNQNPIRLRSSTSDSCMEIFFKGTDIECINGEFILDPQKVSFRIYEEYETLSSEEEAFITKIKITKSNNNSVKRFHL